ncbi:cytochrome P450 2U1-like [Amphiura filiformis]|uniref:cytochrome P450 2U1-like n=1 Tax=Amphiura filiformis TaxID=82378 RepID=UPI003B21DA17
MFTKMTPIRFLFDFLEVRVLLLGVTVFLLLFWLLHDRKPRKLPPGPKGWPVLGYIPNMALLAMSGQLPHEALANLGRKYGNVFSMNLCGQLVIVLNDYDSIKEAFSNEDLLDRPKSELFEKGFKGEGVAFASGEPWKQQRKFCLNVFRNFGVGKKSFENFILKETNELLGEISLMKGKPFDPRLPVSNAFSNIICSLVFGRRYEYSDPHFRMLLDMLDECFRLAGAGGIFSMLPAAKYVFFPIQWQILDNIKNFTDFIGDIIKEHQQNLDPNHLNDFLDAYLNEVRLNKQNGVQTEVNESNVMFTVVNLFVAGTETSTSTLRWTLLYLVANPYVQRRVQEELDEVVGRDRLPRYSDRPNLPYTEATLSEATRMASATPFGLPHAASRSTTLKGFNVPQGSILIPNMWAVHNDPKVWPKPSDFRSERFLDDEGRYVRQESLIPFGIGRRFCLGESLAKMELFLFFTHLLHRFHFTLPDNAPPLSFEPIMGGTNNPHPFKIRAIERH